MNPIEIVAELVHLLNTQMDALVDEDFDRLAVLMERAGVLNQELQAAVATLGVEERAALAGQLREAVERSEQLAGQVTAWRDGLASELREVRRGRVATSAYRHALPGVPALHYSRQG